MCQKCSQYNNILIHNILVPFLEWIIITIFTSLLFIYYDTYARKVFQNSYSFLCSLSSQVQKFVDFLQFTDSIILIYWHRDLVLVILRSTKMSMNSEKLSLHIYYNQSNTMMQNGNGDSFWERNQNIVYKYVIITIVTRFKVKFPRFM